jgi:hypothetical protein
LNLQNRLYNAASIVIPARRFSEKSKIWWSEKLTNIRRSLAQKRRYIRNNQADQQAATAYLQARNSYCQEIKLAKFTSWNAFLENAKLDEVFKAYKYCK